MPDSGSPILDDSTLIQQSKSGNVYAFGILYERYATDIYRFLRAQLPESHEAEDLTSEVFIKAWISLNRYRERGYPFSAYLYKIARNTLIDHWRKKRKENRPIVMEVSHVNLDDPRHIFEQNQELQELWLVLGRLREDYRSVLVLRFINGLAPGDIAAIMGRSEGAVRVLQHRALAVLRQKILRLHLGDEPE